MRIHTQRAQSQESTDACRSLSEQLEVFSLLLRNMKGHHPIYNSSTDLYQLNLLVLVLAQLPSDLTSLRTRVNSSYPSKLARSAVPPDFNGKEEIARRWCGSYPSMYTNYPLSL